MSGLLLLRSSCFLVSNPLKKPHRAAASVVIGSVNLQLRKPKYVPTAGKSWVSCSPTYPGKAGSVFPPLTPAPELALLSLCFVLSMRYKVQDLSPPHKFRYGTAVAAVFSMTVISIPTMRNFRRLSGSIDGLLRVVKEEVPETMISLKLSLLEINELTQKLTSLRKKLSANKDRN